MSHAGLFALTMSCLFFFFFARFCFVFKIKHLKNISHFFHIVQYSEKFMHRIVLHSIVLLRCLLLIYFQVDIIQYNAMHKFVGVSDNPLFVQCKTKEMFKVLHWFHCSAKQNIYFVSCSTNRCCQENLKTKRHGPQ